MKKENKKIVKQILEMVEKLIKNNIDLSSFEKDFYKLKSKINSSRNKTKKENTPQTPQKKKNIIPSEKTLKVLKQARSDKFTEEEIKKLENEK